MTEERTTYEFSSETMSGIACKNCGRPYRDCTIRLMRESGGGACCGSCASTDTHDEKEEKAVSTMNYKNTLEDFEKWATDKGYLTTSAYMALHAFHKFLEESTPKKGEVWRVRCITVYGPEKYTFYMWFDGERFIDGSITYDLDELILEERIGTDPEYVNLSNKKEYEDG